MHGAGGASRDFDVQTQFSLARSVFAIVLAIVFVFVIVYLSKLHHCLLSESGSALRHWSCETKHDR